MHAKYEPYLAKHVVRRSAHRRRQRRRRRRQTNQDCIGSRPTFCREPKTIALSGILTLEQLLASYKIKSGAGMFRLLHGHSPNVSNSNVLWNKVSARIENYISLLDHFKIWKCSQQLSTVDRMVPQHQNVGRNARVCSCNRNAGMCRCSRGTELSLFSLFGH